MLQLEQGHNPEIPIEQLSQQIIDNLIQGYKLELARSYNFQADKELFTPSQKQARMYQFASLAVISIIVSAISVLLLIRQRNQRITWVMTGWTFLPEECVAELEMFYEGLKAEEKAICTINLIMLWNILVLLKSLYIQVAIEDLFLPEKNKRD